jgi:hypothetical protein
VRGEEEELCERLMVSRDAHAVGVAGCPVLYVLYEYTEKGGSRVYVGGGL